MTARVLLGQLKRRGTIFRMWVAEKTSHIMAPGPIRLKRAVAIEFGERILLFSKSYIESTCVLVNAETPNAISVRVDGYCR
jgi:hypothetical protein